MLLDLCLDFDAKAMPARPWWRDGAVLGAILGAVRANDLWLDFRWVGREGGALSRLDPGELLAETRAWEDRGYVLHARREGGLEASHLSLGLRGALLRVQLSADRAAVRARGAAILDAMIELAFACRGAFGGRAVFGEGCAIRVPGLDFETVEPPRTHPTLSLEGLVVFADAAYFAACDALDPDAHLVADLDALRAARLPRGAKRFERDGVLVLSWLDGALTTAAMARACARGQAWLARTLALPEAGW